MISFIVTLHPGAVFFKKNSLRYQYSEQTHVDDSDTWQMQFVEFETVYMLEA